MKQIHRICRLLLPLIMVIWLTGIVQAGIVLKMNHQLPDTATGSRIDQWFADEVFRETGGEVEIRIFWSNRLGQPRDNLALLRNNHIDMAAMSAGYFPEKLPFFAAPNAIPMGMDDVCQASDIMKSFMDTIPAFAEEAAAHGIRPLFFHVLNPYYLISKEPITEFAHLKDKRIRSWGADIPRLIRAAGGRPVNLFLPDIYDAFKHDILDACPFSLDLMKSYELYEVAPHVSEIIIWEGPAWGIWISQQSWDSLTDRQKTIMISVAEQARLRELPEIIAAEIRARQFLKNNGVSFHAFPDSETARWKEVSPDFFAEFIRKMTLAGKEADAQRMMDTWQSLRSQVNCSTVIHK